MSRFEKTIANGQRIAYGYDRPLNEYFLTLYKSEKELIELQTKLKKKKQQLDRSSDVIFAISTGFSLSPHPDNPSKFQYSNTELLKEMDKYKDAIEADHMAAIRDHLPF